MELSVTVSGVLLDVLLATAAFPNPPLAQAESQPYPCGKEQQQVQRLLSGGFQAPRPPHVSTVPPGNHLMGLNQEGRMAPLLQIPAVHAQLSLGPPLP